MKRSTNFLVGLAGKDKKFIMQGSAFEESKKYFE